MYESYKAALHNAIDHHDHELLLPHKGRFNRCGYYPLVTNKSCQELPVEAAMKAHKDQYIARISSKGTGD
jgi:hypothetical protein